MPGGQPADAGITLPSSDSAESAKNNFLIILPLKSSLIAGRDTLSQPEGEVNLLKTGHKSGKTNYLQFFLFCLLT